MTLEVVDALLLAAALPVLGGAGYLLGLALASRPGAPPRYATAPVRFDVVIPAHDEEAGIAATVRSVLGAVYPERLRRVIVVADNCRDATAERAREAGATVLVRDDPQRRGKGFALAHAFERSLADGLADAIVVIDADTVVSPNLLEAFAARVEAGAPAVQADNGVGNPGDSWRTALMAVAFSCFNTVRSLGRERLGLSVGLRGNGMCIATRTLRAVPHDAVSIVEDLEYGIRLGLAGHRVHFAHEARASSQMVSSPEKARSQRLRWEGGRRGLARVHGFGLLLRGLSRRSALLLDLGIDLLLPPLAVLAALAIAGAAAAAAASWTAGRALPSAVAWGACVAAITLYVLRGWWISGTGLGGLRALLHAPLYLAWKAGVAWTRPRGASAQWVRTERERISSVSTSRTVPGPGAGAPQLRHMWVSLVRQRWSALAVVAADGETPTAAVVDALRDVPVPRELGEFRILDARGATAADAERLQGDLAACAAGRVRTVVIVGPIADRMQAIPLTLLADAVLLVVRVGATHLAAARQTLELVGRDRLVGCVALHGDALLAQEPAPQAVPTLVAAKRDAPAASAERG